MTTGMEKSKFDLMVFMTDILINFCEENGLEHYSASEIDYETQEQKEWLDRFVDVWNRVEDRHCERWYENKQLKEEK